MRRRSCSPCSRSLSLSATRRASRVGFGHGVGGDGAEAIEQNALLRLVEAGEGFGLRMDQSELRRELLEHGDGGGLVIDEHAAFAIGQEFRGAG